MNKINILCVVFGLFPGGFENGIVNLINHSSDQFNHIICCLRTKGPFAKRLTKKCIFYELNMKYGNDYSLPYKIIKIIKKEKIDIVRAFNEEPLFYSFIPAKLYRKPIIYYNGGRSFPEKKRRLIVERIFSNLSDKVVLPSTELKNYMINSVGLKERVTKVIYNGVDINRFNKNINIVNKKKELNIPRKNLVIGAIGRLAVQKDLPTFLKIAKKLLTSNPNFTFIIVGEGSLKQELIDFTKELNIDNKVHFLGIRDDVEEIYPLLDFFLLTSRWEGMSNVILEAMASKRTIIVSRVEGVRGLVKNDFNGIICDPGDVEGFTGVVHALASDKEKSMALGQNAFNTVKDTYSIDIMVKKYEDLYLSLLKPKLKKCDC